jgi:hypothetical protein
MKGTAHQKKKRVRIVAKLLRALDKSIEAAREAEKAREELRRMAVGKVPTNAKK